MLKLPQEDEIMKEIVSIQHLVNQSLFPWIDNFIFYLHKHRDLDTIIAKIEGLNAQIQSINEVF